MSQAADRRYTKRFFEQMRGGAKRSAEIVVPLVLDLLSVGSVVDVGCGEGTWLGVFRELGTKDVIGIDGEYVSRDALQIPQECFRAVDLSKPFEMGRVFDLAISLEVAEHLPVASSSAFVKSLCSLSKAVLFSAAVPFQGGNHHVNEQWPDRWAGLFRERGYFPVDAIRKRIWKNGAVEWWYAQNTLLFVSEGLLRSNQVLKTEFDKTCSDQLCVIHPRKYLEAVTPGVTAAARLLFDSVIRSVGKRLPKKAPAEAGRLDSRLGDPMGAVRGAFRRNHSR